ncbi:TY5A, partial [Symbiodinium sp. CCMP2456]
MDMVNQTYERWLRSTPLERLSIIPQGAEKLSEGRWSRLNARVASMLLAAMSVEMKTEMAVNMSAPDASVLAKGLMNLTDRYINQSTDVEKLQVLESSANTSRSLQDADEEIDAEPVQGTPWTIETLIQAAQQVVQGAEATGHSSVFYDGNDYGDRKLEQLKNETLTTRDKLGVSAMAMEKHWNHYLYDYVATGSFESGLRAVRDAPFFEDLPGACISGMVPSGGLQYGWDIFKLNGFLTRAQRRKVMGSKRWVVHLFAGDVGHWQVLKLDQGETSVIELDMARCGGHDVWRDETWRMLLWGAKNGKVDVVMGGPPGRALQHCKGGERDVKSLKLIARMMWLFAVAQVGRELNNTGINKNRDVGFMIEYPEGVPAAERRNQEQQVRQAEEEVQEPGMSPTVASWEETRRYWDQVQRPRWEAYAGHATVNAGVSFWDTRMRKAFQREGALRMILLHFVATKIMYGLWDWLEESDDSTDGCTIRLFIEQYAGHPPPVGDGVGAIPKGMDDAENKEENRKELVLSEQQEKDLRELFGDSEQLEGSSSVVPHVQVVGAPGEDNAGSLDVVDDDEYQPSEPPDEGEEGCDDPDDVQDLIMQNGDCVPPEMTYLTFATALPNNKGVTVKRALQDVV